MESATAVRCPGCGYENNPYYRYCGMCGTPLRAGEPLLPAIPGPPRAPRIPEPAPLIVQAEPRSQEPSRKSPPLILSGMSILGLGNDVPTEEGHEGRAVNDIWAKNQAQDEPSYGDRQQYGSDSEVASNRSVQYLLEDDEPHDRVRGRMYAALILLAIAAGVLVWHWQTNGYPWEELARERAVRSTAKAAQATVAATPAVSTEAIPPKPPSAPATTSELSADASSKAQKTEAVPSPPAPEAESNPGATPPVRAEDSTAPPASVAAEPEPEPEPAPSKEAAVPTKKPGARTLNPASLPEPAPATSNVSATDPAHLFTEGEKYLYGDGVPQDCDRAQKDLRTAAAHSYPQAESLVGTMYASGHCLGRDLPAAYRWYARALRHEPANTRISSDLQVLWGQMTAAERKAAQSSGQ